MGRKEDKNKENTLVNQAKSCKMQIAASFTANKRPAKHFVCVPSSYLPSKNNTYLLGFLYFLKSNFMISAMKDEDLTRRIQKGLQ